jgi:hypothetical protein
MLPSRKHTWRTPPASASGMCSVLQKVWSGRRIHVHSLPCQIIVDEIRLRILGIHARHVSAGKPEHQQQEQQQQLHTSVPASINLSLV